MPDVILPVLDEAEALPWVLGRMPQGYRPIVVDNGSTDGSAEVAARLGAQVVSAPLPGFGSACWEGLQAATAEVVCFMDCDASLDPQDLPSVADPVRAGVADLVLGARAPEPGSMSLVARAANVYLAWRLQRAFGWAVRDLGPMRAARLGALLELGLEDRRSGWPLEMALRAGNAHWVVHEVVVPYRPRTGRSKVTGTVRGTVTAIRDMQAQFDRLL